MAKKCKIVFCLCGIFVCICACSGTSSKKDLQPELAAPSQVIVQKIHEQKSAVEYINRNDQHELKIYRNKYVNWWINYFTKNDRDRFLRFLNRGQYFKEVIQTILEEEELPFSLYYLPLIESGFNTKAHSRAGAVGPWQFVKGTGKRYGLDVNSYVDQRRDAILSTEAAAKYLRDLYNVFNSWELAIAAYNCGEMRVLRAIMKGKTRDFWSLSQLKLLPRETRRYVPKFLAAAYIGEHLSKYKFNIKTKKRFPDVEMYEVPGGTRLLKIAKMLGYSYRALKKINPSLKRHKAPPWRKNYSIWLPSFLDKKIKKVAKKLSRKKRMSRYAQSYIVRKGDNLSFIAKKFKVSLNKIKRINRIVGNKIFPGQKILLYSRTYKRIVGQRFYFVQKNDYLGKIARKFGMPLRYLKRLNGLLSNRIYLGQKLDVTRNVKIFHYVVKKGDHLSKIARLYGTSPARIRKRNSLQSSRIYVGQVLII